MSMFASRILRLVTILALMVSATAMSWAQTSGDIGRLQLHKGHQVSADLGMSVTNHGTDHHKSERHHDTLCATACAVAGPLSEPVSLHSPLALTLRSAPLHGLGPISFVPEPGRRPPKHNPILV